MLTCGIVALPFGGSMHELFEAEVKIMHALSGGQPAENIASLIKAFAAVARK